MPATITYRVGRPDDAVLIGRFVRRVVRQWVLPEQPKRAAAELMQRLATASIREQLRDGRRFQLAFAGHVLVGVSAMRDNSHLFQMYVTTRFRGRGIARKLWQRTMADAVRRAGTTHFTLNATRMAVPVYERLGFTASGPRRIAPNGIASTPMVLVRSKG
ncbi:MULTISPECIES: GNAT family N-acetyltransferase [Dyella]|uniref:GNAT family N-acetyltransferase n=2 Tax=Dyella TaxID=231454 RepID=A0A4R0YGV7_9GAMM|nr:MULTISPECIES: GNAT family N-acetyltransferase [Dyella]TBR37268.1 GNAT family N-acetyltransferase [Dyella terrae]TCI07642.1 GNAT family N-acetyltransferase [Dyella soli]